MCNETFLLFFFEWSLLLHENLKKHDKQEIILRYIC